MAKFSPFVLPLFAITILLLLFGISSAPNCYHSIFSFGDSLADTGNLLLSPEGKDNHAGRFPYGETYFHRPNGRFSNGRLIVDFFAEAMGLPHFLPPFLAGADSEQGNRFRYGVNFAVAGATALDSTYFSDKGIAVLTNYTLSVQLHWFKQLLPSIFTSHSECKDILSRSLFLVGEIGGNDYNYPFTQRTSFDEIKTYVPRVIDAIGSTISELIALGARTLVVPGNFPIGCLSGYLTMYQSKLEDDYDLRTGCIKWLNEFSEYHNGKLLYELDCLRERYPSATIIYADYYNAAMSIFRSPESFGFGPAPLVACCGDGGPYNANLTISCGNEMSNLCDDPSKYVCWDGLHLTEAAYKAIANMLLNSSFSTPAINTACPETELMLDQKQQGLFEAR